MYENFYKNFPNINTDKIIIKKMSDSDLDALAEICSNDNMFRYTPDYFHTQDKTELKTAIQEMGIREFLLIAGVYLPDNPNRLVGTVEMFFYNKEANMIEMGYKVNESYWGQGIASNSTQALVKYLFDEMNLNRIQATVSPDNIKSKNVLLKNGFKREGLIRQAHYWKGKGVVDIEIFSLLRSDLNHDNNLC